MVSLTPSLPGSTSYHAIKSYIQNHLNFGLLASGTGGASESSFFLGGGGGGFFPAAPELEGAKDEAAEATVPACCVAMFIAVGEAATREKPDCRALACWGVAPLAEAMVPACWTAWLRTVGEEAICAA